MIIRYFPLFVVIALASGCATYIPPGEKADLRGIAPAEIEAGFNAKPTAPFPAALVTVRVQAPSYRSHYTDQHAAVFGTGRFSVITAREVEDDAQVRRIADLPQIADVISINRMLLPQRLESDKDLRVAASRLQADLILMYTFDTAFFDTDSAKPLTVITLGLSPTRRIRATTTASALLLDTRTGFVYSGYEATEQREVHSTSWGSRDSADKARRDNERAAFDKLTNELVNTWPRLLERYAKKG